MPPPAVSAAVPAVPAITAPVHIAMPAEAATILLGPIIGTDVALERLNQRSADAMALHCAIGAIRLFGAARTKAGENDHPLVGAILEWRDRYLIAITTVERANAMIAAVDAVDVSDEDRAERIARDVARAISDIAKYEQTASVMLGSLRKAIADAMTVIEKGSGTDAKLILEDVRRARLELDLERRKIEAGVIGRVTEALRVNAGALMAERRRRSVPAVEAAAAEAVGDGPDADGPDAAR